MKGFHILALLLLCNVYQIFTYPTCRQMQISGYLYELSSLPTNANNLFMVKQGISTAYISFCQPKQSCNNKTTFISYSTTNSCLLFTNPTNPMRQNYTLVDRDNPQKGIVINYLPYIDQVTGVKRYATLNIYCPTVNTMDQQCTYTQVSDKKQTIVCNFNNNAGCATLKLNYFWQFLSDNKIVFAILLWVMALFQLFFGYLAIRMTIFIFGILSGAMFGIIYTAQNYVDFIYEGQGYGIAIFVVCLSFLMGILFGVTLLTMPRLGYVNIGLWVAVIFALLLQNSVLYLTGSLLAFYITFGVVGLIMTIIALLKLKNYIILSSSFVSAFWLVRPLGFFLSSYPNQFLSGQSYLINNKPEWQFYLYLISIVVLTVLGSVFQFCCFKKNASGNQAYYLEQQGTLRDKFKKLLQFQQIRNLVQSGADQLRFFKKLIVDDTDDENNYKQVKQAKNNKNSNRKPSQDVESQDLNQFQQQQSQKGPSTGRKQTKIQKQLQAYQSNKRKDQAQNKSKVIYMQQKSSQRQQQKFKSKNNNKKVQQLQQIQFSEQGEQNYNNKKKNKKNQQQQDQESQDIQPNKLTSINKKNRK